MGRINTGGVNKRIGDNIATGSSVSGTTLKLTPPKGYYDGSTGTINITDADFVEANIKNGVNLFGKLGTLAVQSASGSTNSSSGQGSFTNQAGSTINLPYVTVTGLAFTPRVVVVMNNNGDSTIVTPAVINPTGARIAQSQFASQIYRTFRVEASAFVSGGSFQLPVALTNTSYNWYAYE